MKMKPIKDNMPQFLKSISELTKSDVYIGVPMDKTGREEAGPITNAALAYIHNFGAPAANIPARPFLSEGIHNASEKIADRLEAGAKAVVNGDKTAANKSLNGAGLIAVSAVRAKITEGPFEPLKASTLAARRRAGFKGTSPLIRTGQLRRAIAYVIRMRKGK